MTLKIVYFLHLACNCYAFFFPYQMARSNLSLEKFSSVLSKKSLLQCVLQQYCQTGLKRDQRELACYCSSGRF